MWHKLLGISMVSRQSFQIHSVLSEKVEKVNIVRNFCCSSVYCEILNVGLEIRCFCEIVCFFSRCFLYYLLIFLCQELLIEKYLIVEIYYLLDMPLLLWEKLLHLFRNILGVLMIVLFIW